jgi:hypothetical protein
VVLVVAWVFGACVPVQRPHNQFLRIYATCV